MLLDEPQLLFEGMPFYNEARKKQFVETFETAFIMGQ
jgi:hypothetical protein